MKTQKSINIAFVVYCINNILSISDDLIVRNDWCARVHFDFCKMCNLPKSNWMTQFQRELVFTQISLDQHISNGQLKFIQVQFEFFIMRFVCVFMWNRNFSIENFNAVCQTKWKKTSNDKLERLCVFLSIFFVFEYLQRQIINQSSCDSEKN